MWRRFAEDLISNKKGWLILVGVAWVWQAALWIFASDATAGTMTLLAWAPLALTPIWAMGSAGAMLHRRVSSESAVSSKAAGWAVLAAQLVAATVQALVFAGVAALGAWLVFRLTMGVPDLLDVLPIPDVGWVTDFLVKGLTLAFLVVPALVAATQTAYLFGRLVDGYRTALSVWVFVILVWAAMRVLPALTDALRWLPNIPFQEVFAIGPAFEFRTVFLDTAPFGALLLFALALTAATGPLLYHVETTRGLSISDYESTSLRRA